MGWWTGNERRTSESNVYLRETSERDVYVRERDVLVRVIGAGRAVVVLNVVELLLEVSEGRSNKWRVPGAGVGVHCERVGRAVVEVVLLGVGLTSSTAPKERIARGGRDVPRRALPFAICRMRRR